MEKTNKARATKEQVKTPVAKKTAAPRTAPAKADFTPEANTFIVRNITSSILFISDIGLTFKPLQVIDLTFEDKTKTNASKDLRMALKQGQLMRISAKEQDIIENMEIAAEKAKLIKDQKQRRRQMIEIDDKELDAEVLNLNSADSRSTDEEVTTAGQSNDPITYATAYSAAVADAAARGEYLDAYTFQQMVEKNPNVVDQYVRRAGGRGVTSGTNRRGKATVIMPPMDGGETRASNVNMSNFARDHYLAGSNEFGLDTAEVGFAEEIDLADED